jgi:hypothetical protein
MSASASKAERLTGAADFLAIGDMRFLRQFCVGMRRASRVFPARCPFARRRSFKSLLFTDSCDPLGNGVRLPNRCELRDWPKSARINRLFG